jgi:1-acyl-sn-glycerol-3-phosphate acyltransferase
MIVLQILIGAVGLIVGLLVLFVLYLCVCSLFVNKNEYEKESRLYRGGINAVVKCALFFSRVKVEISGKEKLEKINGRFLLVSNHLSGYDPLITLFALKKYHLSFLCKPEVFKIPVVGRFLKRCCFLPIDRKNPRNAILTLRSASKLITSNSVSIGVYPEGTRSKTGEMLAFHDGVFKIAQYAKAPILVCRVSGTNGVKKRKLFSRTHTKLEILDVIDTNVVGEKTSHDLSSLAREMIEIKN